MKSCNGLLICLFVGPAQQAEAVLSRVKYDPTIQWLYEKKPEQDSSEVLTFFGLLTSTFLGIGMALVFIILAGMVAGLIRFEVLRRFPGIAEKRGVIFLDLRQTGEPAAEEDAGD